jgi:hypothetical protein
MEWITIRILPALLLQPGSALVGGDRGGCRAAIATGLPMTSISIVVR